VQNLSSQDVRLVEVERAYEERISEALRVYKKRPILAQHSKSVFARNNVTPFSSTNSWKLVVNLGSHAHISFHF
jgi:hypothetical protein